MRLSRLLCCFVSITLFAYPAFTQISLGSDADSACTKSFGSNLFVVNSTSQRHSVVLNRHFVMGINVSWDTVPLTLGPNEKKYLGCSRWIGDHYGSQSFSLKSVDGKDVPLSEPVIPPQVQPVAPPRPKSFPDNDSTFHYIAENGFSRPFNLGSTAGQTTTYLYPVVLKEDEEIDTSYHQKDDKRAGRVLCCGAGADRGFNPNQVPLNPETLPAGFLVGISGEDYFAAYDPKLIPQQGTNNQALKVTLFCSPNYLSTCSIALRVWVKIRPKAKTVTQNGR
jgi:hypothetical protein